MIWIKYIQLPNRINIGSTFIFIVIIIAVTIPLSFLMFCLLRFLLSRLWYCVIKINYRSTGTEINSYNIIIILYNTQNQIYRNHIANPHLLAHVGWLVPSRPRCSLDCHVASAHVLGTRAHSPLPCQPQSRRTVPPYCLLQYWWAYKGLHVRVQCLPGLKYYAFIVIL